MKSIRSLISTVFITGWFDEEESFLAVAQENWNRLKIKNVEGFAGSFERGCAVEAPYNVILINGAVAAAPLGLADQLAPGGRILAILRSAEAPIGRATLFQKAGEKGLGSRSLFDANASYLPGFGPRPAFAF